MKRITHVCVRVRPIIRRTTRFVARHVVKTSVVGFVPSVVNDTVIHHVQVTPAEIIRVATDDVTVSSMTALAMALMKLL
jgi:hypothetical protein